MSAGVEQPGPIGSVVIPAHNEAAVLAGCLSPLAPLAGSGAVEIVVVCNGCTDRTPQVARSFAGVRVLELATPAKPAALRAGDEAVRALPRIYLDADVVLPADAAVAVLRRLGSAAAGTRVPLAARPPVRFESSGSGWPVRRYYRARAGIPAVLGSLWGAGVYGLSAAARSRFTRFPDVVADDLWVDQLFDPAEVEIVDCPAVTVTAPRTTRELLAVLSRTYQGKAEHHRRQSEGVRETSGRTLRDLGRLARSGPTGLLDAGVYAGLVVTARLLRRLRRGRGWARDESSRAARR